MTDADAEYDRLIRLHRKMMNDVANASHDRKPELVRWYSWLAQITLEEAERIRKGNHDDRNA